MIRIKDEKLFHKLLLLYINVYPSPTSALFLSFPPYSKPIFLPSLFFSPLLLFSSLFSFSYQHNTDQDLIILPPTRNAELRLFLAKH